MLKRIIIITIAVIFLAGCGLLIWNAVALHSAEVAEQVAKFGFYKTDIYLDYGRQCAHTGSIIGAVICGIGAIGCGISLIMEW